MGWEGRQRCRKGALLALFALGTLSLSLSYVPSRQTVLALTPGLLGR